MTLKDELFAAARSASGQPQTQGETEADAKEAPLVGWVVLPLEGMGEQHLQLHAPPQPHGADDPGLLHGGGADGDDDRSTRWVGRGLPSGVE